MLSVYVEVLAILRTCGVDSRPRHADEGDELDDLGNVAKIGLDLFERGREGPALAIEDSEGLASASMDWAEKPARRMPMMFRPVTQL